MKKDSQPSTVHRAEVMDSLDDIRKHIDREPDPTRRAELARKCRTLRGQSDLLPPHLHARVFGAPDSHGH